MAQQIAFPAPASMMMCAFVPLAPNDDTPARRARGTAGHSMASAAMVNWDAPSPAWGVRVSKLRCLGMWPCLTREHGLDESGDACGRFEVTEVGLHRAQHQRRRAVAFPEYRAERVELDRITQRGSGAVGLDVVDVGRRQLRRGQAPGGSTPAARGRWGPSVRCWRRPG